MTENRIALGIVGASASYGWGNAGASARVVPTRVASACAQVALVFWISESCRRPGS